jgi:hypothetical protein
MRKPHDHDEHVALVEIIDRVLTKGVAIEGEVVISVADVELVRLALQLVLGTPESLAPTEEAQQGVSR